MVQLVGLSIRAHRGCESLFIQFGYRFIFREYCPIELQLDVTDRC